MVFASRQPAAFVQLVTDIFIGWYICSMQHNCEGIDGLK
ncbi:MAG: hypothetical protein JWR61_4470 [Ferruginibacter sp.]|jgi:hypothetical protein|nr:hypothetical protein [Ferruginibacter sp.]